jgi:prophage DNA circulation protein
MTEFGNAQPDTIYHEADHTEFEQLFAKPPHLTLVGTESDQEAARLIREAQGKIQREEEARRAVIDILDDQGRW